MIVATKLVVDVCTWLMWMTLLIWWSLMVKTYIIEPVSSYVIQKRNSKTMSTCVDVMEYVLKTINNVVTSNMNEMFLLDSTSNNMNKTIEQVNELIEMNYQVVLATIPASLSKGVIFDYMSQDQLRLYIQSETLTNINKRNYKILPTVRNS